MASQKKRVTKKVPPRSKKITPALWLVPVFSTLVFPSLFILLKEDSIGTMEGLTPLVAVTNSASLDIATCETLQIDFLSKEKMCNLEAEISLIETEQAMPLPSKAAHLYYENLITYNDERMDPPSASTFAFEAPEEPVSIDLPQEETHSRIEIGGDYTYVTIKPSSHSSFHGNLGGAQASYEYRPFNRFYGAVTFDWKEGTTSSSTDTRSLLYFDVQEKLGYTYAPKNMNLSISSFSGLGYRYLGQTLKQKGESSLDFGYNEFYFPVGFLSSYEIAPWFCLGIDFSWMPQVYSTASIDPLKGARWKLNNQLSNFYAEIPFTFTFKENFQVLVKPFYEYWRDGHSNAELSSGIPLGLPGNTYNFYGVNVNFGYCF